MNGLLSQAPPAQMPRIALMGPMGIGKTTALRALCGQDMASSDVPNLDRASHAKAFTTVGAEFGEIDLGDGEVVQVCGCPGQERFDFVRHWLLSVSLGVFIMQDVQDPGAVENTLRLLAETAAHDNAPLALVLSARPATARQLDAFARQITAAGHGVVPVLQADPRDKVQMLSALGVLVAMLSLQVDEESA